MADDLRARLSKAWHPPFYANEEEQVAAFAHNAVHGGDRLHEIVLDRLEAVARAHASERIERFVAAAAYCPFCGVPAESEHAMGCAIESGVAQ